MDLGWGRAVHPMAQLGESTLFVRGLTRYVAMGIRTKMKNRAPLPAKRAVRYVRRVRRGAFEACGSERYSAVAVGRMDRQLAELLGRDGLFLEAGANDGIRYSNTYLLERWYGWRGVLVEAIPRLHADCVRQRPDAIVIHAALGRPGERAVRLVDRDLQSYQSADGQEIPARTISSILDDAKLPQLDLISLDLEGYEEAALQGLDLDRHAPKHLLLEIHDRGRQSTIEHDLLRGRYEPLRWLTGLDVLYRLRSASGHS